MYNLIEYSDNYLKTSESLRKYDRDEPIINDTGVVADFTNNDDSKSFNFKEKATSPTYNNDRKDSER